MNSKPEESEDEEEEGQEDENLETEESQKVPVASQEPEIKLVINMKGKRAVIGVQAPGCDPVLATTEGDLAEILVSATGLLKKAQENWKASPRYPKSDLPQPAAPTPTPVTSGTAVSKAKPAPKVQNALF